MTRENLFTHVFEWNFIFKVALLFVGCSFSNQREIWEMLGVEFTIFSQRIIASLTFWSRFKKLFYFDFIVVVGSCFDQLSSLLFSCPSRSIPTYLTDWVSESSKKKLPKFFVRFSQIVYEGSIWGWGGRGTPLPKFFGTLELRKSGISCPNFGEGGSR